MTRQGPIGRPTHELIGNYIIPFDSNLTDPTHIQLCERFRRGSASPPRPLKQRVDRYKVNLPNANSMSRIRRSFLKSNGEPKDFQSINDLNDAINQYNPDVTSFTVLKKLVENLAPNELQNFFRFRLGDIIRLALKLPELFDDIPLLVASKNNNTLSVTMSQQQIACLLCNAFLCTIEDKNTNVRSAKNYPYFNFSRLYQTTSNEDDVMEKLKCLLTYFDRVTRRAEPPLGVVTFTRRSVSKYDTPKWSSSQILVAEIPLQIDDVGHIHEADGLIQADFANKYLGGGVLGHGAVQEEIRFTTCPELIVSMLITEKLYDNEAVMITGAERYAKFIGYSRSFKFDGEIKEDEKKHYEREVDDYGRHKITIVAIDALNFKHKSDERKRSNIERELNKAWIGFSFFEPNPETLQYPGVATGNWGCGAFNGTPQFKTLIQLMACAEARRPMAYFTYDDTKQKNDFYKIYEDLRNHEVTVGTLFNWMVDYDNNPEYHENYKNDRLYEFIQSQLTQGTPAERRTSSRPPKNNRNY